jgi:hypothetical protein
MIKDSKISRPIWWILSSTFDAFDQMSHLKSLTHTEEMDEKTHQQVTSEGQLAYDCRAICMVVLLPWMWVTWLTSSFVLENPLAHRCYSHSLSTCEIFRIDIIAGCESYLLLHAKILILLPLHWDILRTASGRSIYIR